MTCKGESDDDDKCNEKCQNDCDGRDCDEKCDRDCKADHDKKQKCDVDCHREHCGEGCEPACRGGEVCVDRKCQCAPGLSLCEKDGCLDLDTDVNNCGACGHVCKLPNAVPACVAGHCVVKTCDPKFTDCDGKPDNGCEKAK